jgi:hypothetical protein
MSTITPVQIPEPVAQQIAFTYYRCLHPNGVGGLEKVELRASLRIASVWLTGDDRHEMLAGWLEECARTFTPSKGAIERRRREQFVRHVAAKFAARFDALAGPPQYPPLPAIPQTLPHAPPHEYDPRLTDDLGTNGGHAGWCSVCGEPERSANHPHR